MRLFELKQPLKTNILLEASQVSRKDWVGTATAPASSSTPGFIERLLSGDDIVVTLRQDYTLKGKSITGEPREATFKVNPAKKGDHNTVMANKLADAVAEKDPDKELQYIVFIGKYLDEDGNVTDESAEIPVRQIVKDENFSGKLKVNLGNFAEVALGCAVAAKFKKQDAPIDRKDLLAIATELVQSNEGVVTSKAGKNEMSFRITVPSADKKGFMAYMGLDRKSMKDYGIEDKTKDMDAHIDNAITYANTSKRVADAIAKGNKESAGENLIDIVSDGGNAEEQKSTKADLKILVDGRSINLLSIKAGKVGQFGQVSGWEFERLNEFFEKTFGISLSNKVKKLFAHKKPKEIADPNEKEDVGAMRQQNYAVGFKAAYAEVLKTLNSLAERHQVDLIERVYSGLYDHATRKDPQVEMVILSPDSKKAFSELSFGPELRATLDDYNFSVHAGASEKGMHIIEINGNLISGEAQKKGRGKTHMLIKVRSYAQGTTVRNIIEMGPLLKQIADREELEKRELARQGANPATQGGPEAQAAKQPKASPKIVKAAQAALAKATTVPTEEPTEEPVPSLDSIAQQIQPNTEDDLDTWRKNAGMDVRFSGE
jgi:hypothetical protein